MNTNTRREEQACEYYHISKDVIIFNGFQKYEIVILNETQLTDLDYIVCNCGPDHPDLGTSFGLITKLFKVNV